MSRIVQVAVPRPLAALFDYSVPTGTPMPAAGARVEVPFGNSRVVGIVEGRLERSDHALKALTSVIDETPLLPADLMTLARWLADYYHHPYGEVLATLLPAAARRGAPAEARSQREWRVTGTTPDLARAPKQRAVLDAIAAQGGRITEDLLQPLGIDRAALKRLEARAAVEVGSWHAEYRIEPAPVELTDEQEVAVDGIVGSLGGYTTHLLEGVTSSGKTEVYLRAIAEVLERGGQALVLVPEIALTPQTLARFRARFGAAAALHSAETDARRFDTWIRCRSGEHRILVGTRSAVFAPFRNLGIIVVDEEHDGSFKQQDGLRYSARDVAVKRAQLLGVPAVLGSATPALETLVNARRGRYVHHRLLHRAANAAMPTYHVVDVRGRRLRDGLSEPVVAALRAHLDRGAQVLVFINRRGYAPTLLCGTCGWVATCADCDARLTLHQRPKGLRCHHCDRGYALPGACPDCGGDALNALGTGTQRAETALAELFPAVPLYRIDRDTTRSTRALRARLDAIGRGEPAILVGTQMLAKGHHLPAVTLVAVLDADNGFLSPDFRAPERTAQLIVQVAGRAGRAARPGEVWIQTFDPSNPDLGALVAGGYPAFAEMQSRQREAAGLPPFAAMALVRAEAPAEADAQDFLRDAAARLATPGVSVLGPMPATVARRANRYRYQCAVLTAQRGRLHAALAKLDDLPRVPRSVRWAIDVDPLDTF